MEKPRTLILLTYLALSALVLGGVGLLSSCSFTYRGVQPDSFESNGERIYFTAESSSGKRISYSGGVTMMMSGRNTCANCHGPKGRGGRVNSMMRSFDVPNITWPELTEEHMDHEPFTEETLKQAITQGVDPAGNPLENPMPRWRMSESDLNDLVEFIKTLQ